MLILGAACSTGCAVLGALAGLLLVPGGYLGGTLVFVYGVRSLKQPETPVADALVPAAPTTR